MFGCFPAPPAEQEGLGRLQAWHLHRGWRLQRGVICYCLLHQLQHGAHQPRVHPPVAPWKARLPSRAPTVTTWEQLDKWPVYNAVMPALSWGKCVSLSKQLITNLWLGPWSITLIRYGKRGNWYKEDFSLHGLRLTWQMMEGERIT